MLIIASALLFVAFGIALIVKRREAANLQALLAGGSMGPGCAVAEGVALFVLAAVVFFAYRAGWFGR